MSSAERTSSDTDEARLRVLLVSTSFPARSDDVSGVFVRRLADALSQRVSLEVLTPCGREHFVSDAHYRVHRFRYAPRAWQVLTQSPGGIPAVLKTKPVYWLVLPLLLGAMFVAVYRRSRMVDVIHANWSLTGLVCCLAGLLRGCPVVTTFRGADVGRIDGSPITHTVTRLVVGLSRFSASVSSAMHAQLCATFPGQVDRLVFVPNGVGDALHRCPFPVVSDTLKVVIVGSLIPRKAVGDLISALATLDSTIRIEVTVVGEGSERAALEARARDLGQMCRLSFAGFKPPEEIGAVLCSNDVLVLTSHAEGRPNVVVEAMAAGRAVVATALPGVRELIETETNGLLFAPGDVTLLGEHLRRLAADPVLRLRLGKAARRTVIEQRLTWDASAYRYHELYEAALQR